MQIGEDNRQIRFNAFVEQLYLHSEYYKKDQQVLNELHINPQEYVIIRYIAYYAHQDLAAHPLSDDAKKRIVTKLSKRYRVFVLLEKSVKDSFYDSYTLHISAEKMHYLIASAKLMVTEGVTMASESFVLGVLYLYLNPLRCGYIDYQCKNYSDRAFQTTDEGGAWAIICRMMASDNDTDKAREEIKKLTINPTAFLEWLVEHFPDSIISDYWPTP